LLIAGGKEGKVYVLDRDNLGHFDAANDHALNSVPDGSGHNTPPRPVSGGIFGTPAWFNGELHVTGSIGGPSYAFTLGSDGTLTAASQTSIGTFGYLAGQPLISA